MRRARGYCNDYEDEDELKLNSAQHARSAASRLDDVIDRSALCIKDLLNRLRAHCARWSEVLNY